MVNNTNINWTDLTKLRSKVIASTKFLVIIVALDLLVSVSMSFVLGDAYYFKAFVESSRYETVINDYYADSFFVQADDDAGWVNTPNFEESAINWKTSRQGSRIAMQGALDPDSRAYENSVFLLGSSVINGYSLPYDQTPVSHLKHYGHNVFDFGTVMYSIDQSFALYKNRLAQYQPRIIVVGVHNDPKVISNMFAPFRGSNVSSPFLKPAYYFLNDTVIKIKPPIEHQKNKRYDLMLSDLKSYDACYSKFQLFKRLSLLPFSDLLRRIILKMQKEVLGATTYAKKVELQKYFMREFVRLAKKNNAEVIFVKFESLHDQTKSFGVGYRDKNTIHTELLKSTEMNVLFLSEILQKTGQPIESFYIPGDSMHLNAEASMLLAKKIDQEINNIKQQKSGSIH